MSLIFTEKGGKQIVGDNSSEFGNGITNSNFSGFVYIPEFHAGKKVVEIGTACFRGCEYIKEFIILAKIVQINYQAFYGCKSLEKINIPPTVIFIGYSTFRYLGSSSNSLIIYFEGNSQLNDFSSHNPSFHNHITIYFCGHGPVSYGTNSFESVSSYIIYSSTVSSFLGKYTTIGNCPDFIIYRDSIQTCSLNNIFISLLLNSQSLSFDAI